MVDINETNLGLNAVSMPMDSGMLNGVDVNCPFQ